jgi:hypothetical protein
MTIIHQKPLAFQKLTRQTVDGSRKYKTPDGQHLPSVTTILSATKPEEDKKSLENWRKRVGYAKAQTITTEAANRGTSMHKFLEYYCLGTPLTPGSNLVHQMAYPMAQKIIDESLVHMTEFWGNEISLYFPNIYAGTCDGMGMWRGKLTLFDFKQSNKKKERKWIDDYFLQLSAYILACDEVYNTKIEQGAIFMCTGALEYQEFILKDKELEEYKQKWWDRCTEYYTKLL